MIISVWPGSSSFFPGETPFGFYDNDIQFQIDADNVATFCTRRLGYPLMEVELQDINFYAAFEEAVTTYGNEVYAWKIRENYWSLEGTQTGSSLNNKLVLPTLARDIRESQQYAVEVGVGGNVEYNHAMLSMSANIQTYDMEEWAVSQSIDAGDIEIKRVFYEATPGIVRYFDPYAGTGTDLQGLMQTFGFGSYSPGINFMMMPINFDLQKLQAIDFNDTIRKSNYSFEIRNNKLRIFPIPSSAGMLKFEYILKSERTAQAVQSGSNLVTNVSNVPYENPVYTQVNPVGRSWIYEYTLALAKEMLAYVRGKYQTVPIPEDKVTLNQADLLTDSRLEKERLLARLRDFLDQTSRNKLLKSRQEETEARRNELGNVPMTIYIG